MRFMLLVKATVDSENSVMPTTAQLTEMGAFNEEMVRAGVMLAGDGLRPSKHGARITWTNGQQSIKDGPFAETKELVSGFWVIDVASFEEALEWGKRVPFTDGEIEVRQMSIPEDFGEAFTLELQEAEAELARGLKGKLDWTV